ncbi:methyltransferase-like protein 25B [Topomyia yanbarensis]|uniref:methyltransferase-like protein 25B n=1 Tax=Topomyia yanbarensis TaxID=2498891 RepID=UPI00273B06C5|nr:methyltransferase-like protein 25B [Topomyia yanbarensis]
MNCNELLVANLQDKIQQSFELLSSYDWLINSYVLDFYVDNHWERLPPCWKSCFERLEIGKLKDLLLVDSRTENRNVWPLSICALRVFFRQFCLSRKLELHPKDSGKRTRLHEHYQKLFHKSVKLKKRHEIEKFCDDCQRTGKEAEVEYLVDVGSGQGNLARTLAYGYGFKVCCIEQDEQLTKAAKVKDEQLSSSLKKQFNVELSNHPIHLSRKVDLEKIEPEQFLQMIRDSFNVEKESPFRFGLIGLHPCGDLAVFLIKLFLSCPEAKFIKLVCCCYMKLSTQDQKSQNYGFPLSEFSKSRCLRLNYEALEIACHAIEQYCNKLDGHYDELKVHAYRAAIEKIIVKLHPTLKHSGLKSTKVTDMSFQLYCDKATSGLGIELPQAEVGSKDVQSDLNHWERVVKFYTLRLMFAPLIESVVLYDRLLFMLEQGISSKIEVIFDPICSPRNHALTGCK